jgi:HAD superfamily hydrolase (TIGR01549 family)
VIRAIIFDCFGVLTTDTWRAFIDSLPEGANVERARELNRAVDAGVISHQEFLEGVEEATGFRPPEIEKMMGGEVTKNVPLLDYIRTLKPDYAIGMISNISSNWIRDSFLTPEEQELFDEMVMSHEVGMTKPDPRIFMLACERLRVGPHEAVMIDDIDRYIAAAEGEGLKGIVYQDLQQLKQQLAPLLNTKE